MVVVHNSCKKADIEFDLFDYDASYANKVIGPNPTVVNKNDVSFNVSSNSNWTWRLDYHGTSSRLPQTHINLEIWKLPFGARGNTLLENIHLGF